MNVLIYLLCMCVAGKVSKTDNPLKNAPHTVTMVSADEWPFPYSRAQAAYPVSGLKQNKFWPSVGKHKYTNITKC